MITNQVQLANAVRDGARAAGVCGGVVRNSRRPVPTLPDGQMTCTTANLEAYITARLTAVPGGVVPAVTVTANGVSSSNLDACSYGGTVDVRITYRQPLYAPFVDVLIGDGPDTGVRTITAEAHAAQIGAIVYGQVSVDSSAREGALAAARDPKDALAFATGQSAEVVYDSTVGDLNVACVAARAASGALPGQSLAVRIAANHALAGLRPAGSRGCSSGRPA